MAKLQPISGNEFERFLTAKGVTAGCVTCQLGDLIIHDEELAGTHVALVAFKFPDIQPAPASHYSVLMVVCGNCGTYRLVDRATVANWLAENPSS
jgi:hypothetical protein